MIITCKRNDGSDEPRVYRGETYNFLFQEPDPRFGTTTTVAARDGRLEEIHFNNWEELPVAKH